MNVIAILVAAALTPAELWAGQVQKLSENRYKVTIHVVDDAAVPRKILALGEGLASTILTRAGVRVTWRHGRPAARELLPDIIVVQIKADAGTGIGDSAVAYALPFEGSTIVILYGRIRWAEQRPTLVPRLLAHVLAHEITHILQGVERHSRTGLMKAQWTASDYNQMLQRPLPLEPDDIELIHRGLNTRLSRLPGQRLSRP